MALDTRCSYICLGQIAENIVKWEELAVYFELTPAEIEEIRNDYPYQYKMQKHAMLWKWIQKNEDKATYRAMKNNFESAKDELLTAKVMEMLHDCDPAQPPVLNCTTVADAFKQYLKDCYTIAAGSSVEGHPGTANTKEMGPPLSDQAPFIGPELYLVLDKENKQKKIVIDDLLKEKKAQKVLLEGIAGTGKTTLTRHICQQWAEGTLFRHVNLLVHLTLGHPFLWDAESLDRLIPHPSAEFRKAVAEMIKDQQGKGCCFILDGWEDLPKGSKLASFIYRCLEDTNEVALRIPHCSFVVTSRPIASDPLQPLVTTTVEITKLSPESVHTYATQYLTQHGKDPTLFITELNKNPQARGLCSLPMNAAIMLHLFLFLATGLPTTQTELFKSFILNLLLHHLARKKEQYRPGQLADFSFLSAIEAKSFKQLCSIAHKYSFIDNVIFSAQSNQLLTIEELQQAGLHDPCVQNTLGLMKVHHRLTWCGYAQHYGFLHSSVQDFLCALRMSQLSPDEQVRDFKFLIHNNSASLILSFYAGITCLNNEGVCSVLRQIGNNPPQEHTAVAALVREGIDYRRLFVAYLHCLYEANKGIFVEPDLQLDHKRCNVSCGNICFDYLKLSAHDANVIWYYMLDFVRMLYPTNVTFSFRSCHIGDLGIESASTILLSQEKRYGYAIKRMPFGICLNDNNIGHRGVSALSRLLSKVSLNDLNIGDNNNDPLSSSGFILLKSLTEGLSFRDTVIPNHHYCINLFQCHFTSRHGYHLLLLMPFVQIFEVSLNKLQSCVPLLVSAANNAIKLQLCGTEIEDEELIEIGHILQSNTHPEYLVISSTPNLKLNYSDSISPNTVCEFIKLITAPKSRSTLKHLKIANNYMQAIAQDRIQAELRRYASTRGYQLEICPMIAQEDYMSILVESEKRDSLPKTVLAGK